MHLPTFDAHEFVRRFFEMANAHDFDRLADFLQDEVVVNGVSLGRQSIVAQFKSYDAAVPDLHWKVLDEVAEGDSIAVRLTDSGTPVSEFFGFGPTGASVAFTETAFWRVVDVRISAMAFVFDVDALRSQLTEA
ncbi:ester cyclase [Frondihabitans sp. VKM Ac-2883]|uniref:ester cyclase n=1 Tax=Frondihabitans sp. VKM Ac-2883 TaxID=2783823 RepID=UPI00188DB6F0|nr:ester cyclase [Frondihabitans sp. VKM Ac-2883]MBF4577520.1 ester cyclase [Frondihabitans sp. VKM Ac-2883]